MDIFIRHISLTPKRIYPHTPSESLITNLRFCFFLGQSYILDIPPQKLCECVSFLCLHCWPCILSQLYVCSHAERLSASCFYVLTSVSWFQRSQENYYFQHQLTVLGRDSSVLNCIPPYEVKKRTLSCFSRNLEYLALAIYLGKILRHLYLPTSSFSNTLTLNISLTSTTLLGFAVMSKYIQIYIIYNIWAAKHI